MAAREITRRRRKERSEYFFDYSLLFIVLFLLGFGLVMIYSASSYEALDDWGDAAHYFTHQLKSTLIGLFFMVVTAIIPYRFWEKLSGLAYLFSMALIPVVLTPIGVESHGARRWIRIPGLGNLQPAEVVKVGVILFLAMLICKMGKNVRKLRGFFFVMAIPFPAAFMIWKITDNLSSAIIVMGIAFVMVFVASPDYKKFVVIGAMVAAGLTALVIRILTAASVEDFRSERIIAWLDPEGHAQGKGFQTIQALYAIGSGGIWGKGLGESMQKLNFIPEAQNDMIFSIICEELGLFGAIAIILMFIMLLWRMMIVANNAPDFYGAMLVVGVIGHIAIQAILNIAVVTNIVPNTGISLPFISYGGSSVIFLLIEMGLVFSVSVRIKLKDIQ